MKEKILDAYERGGIKEVSIGTFNVMRKPFEKNIISRTRWEIPYYVQRHHNRAKRYVNILYEKGIGRKIDYTTLKSHKQSDTIFVLGSGASINQITEEQWKHIDSHDSIGLNRWPAHEFVPTYYVSELSTDRSESYKKQYWNLFNDKKSEYENTPFILKNPSTKYNSLETKDLPEWIRKKVILSCDSGFTAMKYINREKNRQIVTYMHEKDYFDQRNVDFLYRMRGSISYLIHLAVVLGYKKIVLCGVDMVNSKYFFEHEDYQNKKVPRIKKDVEKGEDHKTYNKKYGDLTLDKVIYDLTDLVLNPNKIDIYVENTISALHPKISKYNYPIEG
jgi:hypothetical protein